MASSGAAIIMMFLFIASFMLFTSANPELLMRQLVESAPATNDSSYSSQTPPAPAAPVVAQPPSTTFPTRGAYEGSLKPEECSPRCAMRCSNTQYKKPCLFFCNKCCDKCLCVPPGTYGNKNYCPCYDNWKTKRGGPKCP